MLASLVVGLFFLVSAMLGVARNGLYVLGSVLAIVVGFLVYRHFYRSSRRYAIAYLVAIVAFLVLEVLFTRFTQFIALSYLILMY